MLGIFKKKEKKEKGLLSLTVKEVIPIAEDAVSLIFEKPEETFDYQPGQYLTLVEHVNGDKIRRAYSLFTDPGQDAEPGVTVKRVKGGKMSNHINDTFSAGQNVQVMPAMGTFTPSAVEASNEHLVLFAGGSGITPIYSILRSTLGKNSKSKIDLIYGNTSESHIIFKEQLSLLEKEYEGLNIVHILENNSDGFAGFQGRPSLPIITEILDDIGVTSTSHFFICGPTGMMDLVQQALTERGVSKDHIKIENFVNEVSSEEADVDAGVSKVILHVDGETHELELKKSKPILEQALAEGIDLPYSCQNGVCTACRGKCLEGQVTIDKVEGLTEAELNDGYVLPCVGKAQTDEVEIEIG